uniref:Tim44-like domain-containing protein n=1 Tax=Magnetococcus massalia (strain MO-1) TaxID=451514 RepID=A0A1S7LKJ1_MAGMO|nr:Protein of unknown function. Import inner membrane translocase, subunit Tim44 [Candidatus Magnetococcus massalia]
MYAKKGSALFGILLMAFFSALSVWPEDAEARMGKKSSFGKRGSRSMSVAPRSTSKRFSGGSAQRSRTQQAAPVNNAAGSRASGAKQQQSGGGMGSALLGGAGGMLLGGMIGSQLAGGGDENAAQPAVDANGNPVKQPAAAQTAAPAQEEQPGGGFGGILMLLLLGGGLFLLLRRFTGRKPAYAGAGHPSGQPMMRDTQQAPQAASKPHPISMGGNSGDMNQTIAQITDEDPNFNEFDFIDGAKRCFEMMQSAWSNYDKNQLAPLLTEQMLQDVDAHASELAEAGHVDMVEQIQFSDASMVEGWREDGSDFLTVRFDVSLVEYVKDNAGNVVDGDPNAPQQVMEYWTFTRNSATQDPNWKLTAIQQSN